LAVLDVSEPAHPALVGVSPSHFFSSTAVQVVGNYAYVIGFRDDSSDDYLGVLHVFEVSNPTHPLSLAGIDLGGEEARALHVVGNYAYVAGDAGLKVVNVSNPANPIPVGAYETDSSGLDVQVVGGFVYLLTQDLKVIDVSNPSKPMLADQFHLAGDEDDVGLDIAGNHAYVANASGLTILEITQLPHFRSISRLGDKISFSWNGALGLKLQRTTTLTNPVWTEVPNSGGQSSMEMPIGGGHEFFRLMKP
jgi:hypothetical protein